MDNGNLIHTYVTKGSFIVQSNFDTEAEAIKWLKEFAKKKGNQQQGKQDLCQNSYKILKEKVLIIVMKKDVEGNDYLGTFNFKGGEFGNWVNQNERQTSLNYGYDAYLTLANALGIEYDNISFNGTLSIAFGSRGSGNALAHYEPLRKSN